jgi:hypothetical protein
MSGAGKLTQKQVDKLVDKAAKGGVADLLALMDKHRSSSAVAAQALARMLSSPLDQARSPVGSASRHCTPGARSSARLAHALPRSCTRGYPPSPSTAAAINITSSNTRVS